MSSKKMTAGWNDPPLLSSTKNANNSSMEDISRRRQELRQKKRPVDPSIDNNYVQTMVVNRPKSAIDMTPQDVEKSFYARSEREALPNAIYAPSPNNNVLPPVQITKAAGDLSLNGTQLVGFLSKSIEILPPGPIKDGISLRLATLDEQFKRGVISAACQMKLNYLVDAIFRSQFDEAWELLDQMNNAFPGEVSPWNQGTKMIIMELKKVAISRQSSTGI